MTDFWFLLHGAPVTMSTRLAVVAALILTAFTPAIQPLHAQDAAVTKLDEADFRTIEADEEPAPEPLTLDADGVAQVEGVLDVQGMASYVLTIEAGASVQAAILPGDAGFVLTVVGADGNPLQTDHVGASSFDQIVPVSQVYTFKAINIGEERQAYRFGVVVTPGVGEVVAVNTADDDLALGEQLVRQFLDALRDGDADAMKALLSPAFQIMNAVGERFSASDYGDNLAVFAAYEVDNLKVTRSGDILVATYALRTSLTKNISKFAPPAPHLSVFQQSDGAWKVVAHANFAAPVTAADLLTAPESQIAAPSTLRSAPSRREARWAQRFLR
ncbi:MAG: hypothetical protein BroJett021_45820 [Chloroflexota bacterium]|nr:DUF4440 domain-containing protein [Caldilinea sp.]GIK75594.1 MAG: hypothetical protein BroJett021_45820 [Chloroflexota bacterium]